MTFKISSSRSVGFGQANRTSSEFAKSNLHPNTDGQNKTAFEHLGKTLSDKPDGAPEPAKTLQNFLDKVLAEQPIDENLKKKNAVLIIEPNKPPAEMSAADYKRAFHRALLKKAGYENLSEAELTMAMNLHPVDLKNFDIENLRREDAKPGVMTIDADEFTIAAANRAAQAVLQYQTDRAEKSTEAKAKAESETNQMLIEPFKLGGNVPVRWLERILNTPKELLRQIDKGEIMPGSSTAKWIGGKIGEYITGKPAPPMKTASESIEELTGAKLPAIPEVELPRPFEYQTDKYKADGKTGEDVGATAIDILLLKRGIAGKPNTIPQSLDELNGLPKGFSDLKVRNLYNEKLNSLNINVEFTEKNARFLVEQRNIIKAEARNLMINRQQANLLDKTRPIQPFEYYVDKYSKQGYTGDALWEKIITGSAKPNAEVNKLFGIEK